MAASAILNRWLARNWFVPLAALLLGLELAFARTTEWAAGGYEEAAILFDMAVFVPLLHLVCYRRTVSARALAIRTAALVLSGIYLASLLVPAEAQRWVDDLGWLRAAGVAAIALVELKIMFEVMKLVFGGGHVDQVVERSGAPAWVVRLMLLEARFWKAVWRLIRGR